MIFVDDKSACSGCYACSSICPTQCISMEVDEEGFWYPHVKQQSCIQCHACEKACPILTPQQREDSLPNSYAAFAKDETIRQKSSSGGIFTLLAEWVLEKGGVVFGAAYTEDLSVAHIAVECQQELEKLRGSKYVQSRIGDTYSQSKKYLEQERYVLFSGTPCQIEGLHGYLGREYATLLCVDLVCHGVPSLKLWEEYRQYRERCAGASVRRVCFREKGSWRKYAVSIEFSNSENYKRIFIEDPFMQMFLQNICIRPSCYQCSFKKLNRLSDITLADFWGIEHVAPEMDDDKGISLILVQSSKGESALEEIQESMERKQVNCRAAIAGNLSAIQSSPCPTSRKSFFQDLGNIPFDRLEKRYLIHTPKAILTKLLGKTGLLPLVRRIYRIVKR